LLLLESGGGHHERNVTTDAVGNDGRGGGRDGKVDDDFGFRGSQVADEGEADLLDAREAAGVASEVGMRGRIDCRDDAKLRISAGQGDESSSHAARGTMHGDRSCCH
jgi:hypothetical protein